MEPDFKLEGPGYTALGFTDLGYAPLNPHKSAVVWVIERDGCRRAFTSTALSEDGHHETILWSGDGPFNFTIGSTAYARAQVAQVDDFDHVAAIREYIRQVNLDTDNPTPITDSRLSEERRTPRRKESPEPWLGIHK